jgi:hypothetical protein
MKAESPHTIVAGQFRLSSHDIGQPQVIEPEFSGQMRLVVPGETGDGLGDVCPLGKAPAPPSVIFRNRMVLREIEGNEFHGAFRDLAYRLGMFLERRAPVQVRQELLTERHVCSP